MIRVGFTGTQHGMTERQKAQLTVVLRGFEHAGPLIEFHHGDCIGADAEARDIADDVTGALIICHPPTDPSRRAFTKADVTRDMKPYLERNRDIVDESTVLVAAPRARYEELRSGTWATIRYARRRDLPVVIIYP